ncbi:methylated-DNA--[protein]-cysteine S-methyltransferase [Brevibacillus sp. AF8]|uniref:methylated-DNA--[protein]-cysteine S-methyltransferase n=1 Tax=Brevibacillus sp. AF8 TaxID=2825881 RepID=UPI001E3A5518|nr:methylated-DNA--[protein]-cysteine S-methyltransferase [Brevibacillus sp. AF8]MCE0451039.1 methylated-DNA--[protein]-cysteine S-methyltransferase [Brevibacillus sp. AF8]
MEMRKNQTVHWSILVHGDWTIYLAATAAGLCYVGSVNQPFAELEAWVKKHHPQSSLVQDDLWLKPFATELMEYLQGTREHFSMDFDLSGTPFQLAVWEALRQIPYGQTVSYTDIATIIEKPAAVRAVGAAIGANPVLITVPCHRVVGKNGSLTGYRGGLPMKTTLLDLEKKTNRGVKHG